MSEMSCRYLGIQVNFKNDVTQSSRFGSPLGTNDTRVRGEKGNPGQSQEKKGKKAESQTTLRSSIIIFQKDEVQDIKRS